MIIGVLALQGDFAEHLQVLYQLGVEAQEVRLPTHLENLAGLILPGGESTTIGKLASNFGLMEPLRRFAEMNPVWGTCAGAIFLAKNTHSQQPLLGLMDITVQRNAFGRQVDSFEADLKIPVLQEPDHPFRAIFIRAPIIESVGEDVDVLARLEEEGSSKNGRIVAAKQQNLLVSSFHPELTQDTRFHRYFLSLVEEA
ncbi:MAG: glutamine amidotransferase subunit PdxT [Chloroflexi bacterium RBG_16_48_8]|nr:MAG: glutamine amidotransferase subunit PdxT [Chloroflexi bacterium RBG_16_48_8]